MKLPPPKRTYCAYCGRVISSFALVWQDEEGRVFRFHRTCSRKAETQRAKDAATKIW